MKLIFILLSVLILPGCAVLKCWGSEATLNYPEVEECRGENDE